MRSATRLLAWCFLAALTWLPAAAAQDPEPFKKEEIEQLVAPIALYPDPLVAQILMASTYPLEVVSAARWVKANPGLKDKALEDALQKQTWDPSVKSLTAFPQVLDMMNQKLELTQRLGDAFLAQQKEVLDAIQRLRGKAEQAGNLKSSKEQTVTSAQEGGQTVIKIEPSNPEVVYVPTYSPAVYGAWPYPAYPPYAYYPPGYVPGAMLFSFAVGVAVGNAMWGNCNWGGGNVNINTNRYNNFNRTNVQNGNWQHNAEHRGGAGYRDKGSQQRYGGGQRAGVDSREQFRGRAEQGRQDISRGGGAGNFQGGGNRQGDFGNRATQQPSRGGAGGGREPGGFQGMGNGAQTRDFSSRGASSRSGSYGGGGGGARAGGGGGGGRAGGGGGGGGRGGGGGGRR
jgi:hypothetical protein